MDIGLPGIDGIMAAKLIREQEKGRREQPVPIIALSAHDDQAIQAEALAAGMNDYVIKPISLQLMQNIFASVQHSCSILENGM